MSQHLEVNKCMAPSLGQEVCRGPAGVDGSGTEGDMARFLVYNKLQTPKRWTRWEAGRPESKEAVRPELGNGARMAPQQSSYLGSCGKGTRDGWLREVTSRGPHHISGALSGVAAKDLLWGLQRA